MWAIDRPINDVGDVNGSCVHRTSFCDASCYNVKLYKMFKGMAQKDIANEKFWQSLPTNKNDNQDSLKSLQQKLFRSRRQTKRARLMTRGEAIKDMSDVFRIKTLAVKPLFGLGRANQFGYKKRKSLQKRELILDRVGH